MNLQTESWLFVVFLLGLLGQALSEETQDSIQSRKDSGHQESDPNKYLTNFIWNQIMASSLDNRHSSATSSLLRSIQSVASKAGSSFNDSPYSELASSGSGGGGGGSLQTSESSSIDRQVSSESDDFSRSLDQQPRGGSTSNFRSSHYEPQQSHTHPTVSGHRLHHGPYPVEMHHHRHDQSSGNAHQQQPPTNRFMSRRSSDLPSSLSSSSTKYLQQSLRDTPPNYFNYRPGPLPPQPFKSSASYSGPPSAERYFQNLIQSGRNSRQKYNSAGVGVEGPQFVKGRRTVQIMPMINGPNGQQGYEQGKQQLPALQSEPQIIEINPDDSPIQVVFRSQTTRVKVQQIHTPIAMEEVETTRTEEHPQRVVHQLLRPVIQEVIEVIQPYRRITQEVRPVLEEVHTIIAKKVQTKEPQEEEVKVETETEKKQQQPAAQIPQQQIVFNPFGSYGLSSAPEPSKVSDGTPTSSSSATPTKTMLNSHRIFTNYSFDQHFQVAAPPQQTPLTSSSSVSDQGTPTDAQRYFYSMDRDDGTSDSASSSIEPSASKGNLMLFSPHAHQSTRPAGLSPGSAAGAPGALAKDTDGSSSYSPTSSLSSSSSRKRWTFSYPSASSAFSGSPSEVSSLMPTSSSSQSSSTVHNVFN